MDGQTGASPEAIPDLDTCDRCGGLTIRGDCRTCVTERVVARARIRPLAVVARRASDRGSVHPGVAVLVVPDDASQAAFDVAQAIAVEATVRLHLGDRLDYALTQAPGVDWLCDRLDLMAKRWDRKTVRLARDELDQRGTLHYAGQLAPQKGKPAFWKGAFLYTLNVRLRQLGEVAVRAITKATTAKAGVRGTGFPERIEGCLSWAIRAAYEGCRNSIGHWLACRCTDAGLSEVEAIRVLGLYRAGLGTPRTYTEREAQATVRNRYRRVRGPVTLGASA